MIAVIAVDHGNIEGPWGRPMTMPFEGAGSFQARRTVSLLESCDLSTSLPFAPRQSLRCFRNGSTRILPSVTPSFS